MSAEAAMSMTERAGVSIRHLVFDFDGVLAESNLARLEGFRLLFADYPAPQVNELLAFARAHGGLSRYGKIRHFFQAILGQPLGEERLADLAARYSELVSQAVIQAPAVKGSLEFLAAHQGRYGMALVSGSDQEELRRVCRARGIESYFSHILGSPTEKEENLLRLAALLDGPQGCVYVGDALGDRLAARAAGMAFIARSSGSTDWAREGEAAIADLSQLASRLKQMETTAP